MLTSHRSSVGGWHLSRVPPHRQAGSDRRGSRGWPHRRVDTLGLEGRTSVGDEQTPKHHEPFSAAPCDEAARPMRREQARRGPDSRTGSASGDVLGQVSQPDRRRALRARQCGSVRRRSAGGAPPRLRHRCRLVPPCGSHGPGRLACATGAGLSSRKGGAPRVPDDAIHHDNDDGPDRRIGPPREGSGGNT